MWIKLKPSLHFCQAESNLQSFSERVEAKDKMEAQIFFLKMRKDVNQMCFSNSKIEEFSLDHFYQRGLVYALKVYLSVRHHFEISNLDLLHHHDVRISIRSGVFGVPILRGSWHCKKCMLVSEHIFVDPVTSSFIF